MDSRNKIIHQEKFFNFKNFIPTLLLIIAWGIFFGFGDDSESLFYTLLFTAIMLLVFVVVSRRKSTYNIYENNIEFFSLFSNKLSHTISFEQIDQIRYEDGFEDSYGLFWSNFIIIYPKKGITFKNQKNNRITLSVTGLKRKSKILKLLKFFQSKNLKVVIKTDSKKILRETGLKNWDHV